MRQEKKLLQADVNQIDAISARRKVWRLKEVKDLPTYFTEVATHDEIPIEIGGMHTGKKKMRLSFEKWEAIDLPDTALLYFWLLFDMK